MIVAKVLEYQLNRDATPGVPAGYRLRAASPVVCDKLYTNAGEALSAIEQAPPGLYALEMVHDEVPGTEAVPGKVVLELGWDEAMFLRRLLGSHITGPLSEGICRALRKISGFECAPAYPGIGILYLPHRDVR